MYISASSLVAPVKTFSSKSIIEGKSSLSLNTTNNESNLDHVNQSRKIQDSVKFGVKGLRKIPLPGWPRDASPDLIEDLGDALSEAINEAAADDVNWSHSVTPQTGQLEVTPPFEPYVLRSLQKRGLLAPDLGTGKL